MRGIHDLLERRGYVKLSDYGLVLTPDRRILATRPAILDDGVGGAIVGWLDGDLAAAELERWAPPGARAPRASRPPPILRPAASRSMAVAAPITAPMPTTPVATPVAPVATPVAPVPSPSPSIVKPKPDDEEDWQWQIAMAQARAAADDVADPPPPTPPPSPPPVNDDEWDWEIAMARARAAADDVDHAVTAVRAMPAPRIAATHDVPQLPSVSTDEAPRPRPSQPSPTPADRPAPVVETRRTVIPVPTLPVANAMQRVRPLEVAPLAQLPRRLPRGTIQRIATADDEPTQTLLPKITVSDARR